MTNPNRYTSEGQADWPDFAQGARCGHLEGNGRAGSYTKGEETMLSYEAASVNVPNEAYRYLVAWAMGYEYGYRLAVEGSKLPSEVESAPLPKP